MTKKYDYKVAKNLNELTTADGMVNTPLDKKTIAKDIPCQEACPVQTNVPGYIEAIANKAYGEAYSINQNSNVFPGVLGRVCTRPCEDRCRHQWTNTSGPVNICHLKRSSYDLQQGGAKPLPAWYDDTGKNIAIIGGGPAGLTAARDLKRLGHNVEIFEKEPKLGGMMTYGIPRFRLPDDVVDTEVKLIVDSGIRVTTGSAVDGAKISSLLEEKDAVLISTGTSRSNELAIDGLNNVHFFNGLDFMNQYNTGKINTLEGDVLIIGGGFTAVDCARGCARAAKRLVGEAGNVAIMYRRSEQYMAADMEEMDELRNEQIEVRTLVSPLKVNRKNGKLQSVTFVRNMLTKAGPDAKPKMTPVPDSNFDMACDHLVIAIGQNQDWSLLPKGVDLSGNGKTTHPKLFTAGDYDYGSKDIITAVSSGKKLALDIDETLMGECRIEKRVKVETIDADGETGRLRDHDLQIPAHMPTVSVVERAIGDTEVETGYDAKAAESNATRCYLCHYKYEIDQDKCIHCNWCIEVAPRECIYPVSRVFHDEDGAMTNFVEASVARDATYIMIDSNECIRCGACLRICPTEAISMKKMALVDVPCSKKHGVKK